MSYRELLGKRRAFVDAYIGEAHCCKAEAAALAGYRHPNQEGYRLCKDPDIRAAIEERLKGMSMGPEEILRRLEQQASGDMGEFLTVEEDGGFRIDLTAAKRAGKLRLIKKAGFDQKGRPAIELYDAQAALVALSKRFALLPDRQEITGADGGPVRVGISYSEALSELKAPAVVPELPEGTRLALSVGEELERPEAATVGAIGL